MVQISFLEVTNIDQYGQKPKRKYRILSIERLIIIFLCSIPATEKNNLKNHLNVVKLTGEFRIVSNGQIRANWPPKDTNHS